MLAMTGIVVTSSLPVILDYHLHDDSFYYLKVAENLATGHGSTFDGVNYTNFDAKGLTVTLPQSEQRVQVKVRVEPVKG